MPYSSKEQKLIRVFHSHIEVYPYLKGEEERLERNMSVWIDAEFRFEPKGYYISNNVLYLPRGYNLLELESIFGTQAYIVHEPDEIEYFSGIYMTTRPRNRIQNEAIDFLSSDGAFKTAKRYSQQALTLDTGDGKTYTTVHSILNYRMNAVIITQQESIREQWKNTFLEKTNALPEDIMIVNGSHDVENVINGRKRAHFYLVHHQTLKSFATTYGWEMVREFFKATKAGIKVFDEAHKYFENVIRVDMFSNTMKTFYLTANFTRGDEREKILFKKAFSSVIQFGEETKDYEEKRKHIVYVPVLYHSNPTMQDIMNSQNRYGFSVLNFSDYALHLDEDKSQIKAFYHVFEIANRLEGKILITVPRIDDTEFVRGLIVDKYPDIGKLIATIHSKNSKEDNESSRLNSDIIVSTIKSCGTGVDIPKLRCVINMEPFSSNIIANQLSGRLREYSSDKDTYFFDIIDIGFSSCDRQYKTKLKYLKKKCKEIKVMKLEV